MGLRANLVASQAAIEYINNRMCVPSSNWPGLSESDRARAMGLVNSSRTELRAQLSTGLVDRFFGGINAPKNLDEVVKVGEVLARGSGGVHCGEKSAVAFVYIMNLGLSVAHMTVTGGNHDLVVVGSSNPIHKKVRYYVPIKVPPACFGPDAVVCDPWYRGGVFYPVSDWAPYFENSIKCAFDKDLSKRRGWDSPESLALTFKTSIAELTCISFAPAGSNAQFPADLPPCIVTRAKRTYCRV